MKRYNPESRISTIAALSAVLGTAATIGVAVLLPAQLAATDVRVVAAKAPAAEVAIIPSIEVIGYRTERTAADTSAAHVHEARAASGPSRS